MNEMDPNEATKIEHGLLRAEFERAAAMTRNVRERMLSFREYNDALGISEVEDWEKKYLLSR